MTSEPAKVPETKDELSPGTDTESKDFETGDQAVDSGIPELPVLALVTLMTSLSLAVLLVALVSCIVDFSETNCFLTVI